MHGKLEGLLGLLPVRLVPSSRFASNPLNKRSSLPNPIMHSFYSPVSLYGGVAEWLRHSVLILVRTTRLGSNPEVGATDHKPTVNPAVSLSEAGK